MKKRLVSILLAMCMVLTLLPITALASESDFVIESGVLTKYNGSGGDVVIPNSVTSIGDGAFSMGGADPSITSVTIPDSVTSIGEKAFYYCIGLTSVTIPDSVTSIGVEAFARCGLSNVTIGDSVTSIGKGVFYYCSRLNSVTIPDSVTSIGDEAFYGCSGLNAITIGDGVASIGYDAFHGCSSLTNVTIPTCVVSIAEGAFNCSGLISITVVSGNQAYTSVDGVLFNNDKTLLHTYPAQKSGSLYTIPDSVTSIGVEAFSGCGGLTSITIPNSVTSIGFAAFSLCESLTSITIPNGVTRIDDDTFHICSNLTSVTIPNSVTYIGRYAFSGCDGITDVYYSGSEKQWKSINVQWFNDSLTSATIHYNSTGPDDTKKETINGILRSGEGWSIRWECQYSKHENGVPCDGKVKITVNDTNTFDELYLYDDSGASGFPWEREPYNIPKAAITSLVVEGKPTKHLRFTANSFQGYTALNTVSLLSVSGIDTHAFEGCTSLEKVNLLMTDGTLARIGKGAFKGCTSLKEMAFPDGLTSIGDEAFQNTALGTITIGTGVAEIGMDAFSGCANLKIRCYENSTAHKYAQQNSIPFDLISEALGYTSIYYKSGAVETFEHNLDYYISQTASTIYNPTLSHMLIALSCAAYDESNIKESMKSLGFRKDDILTHYIPGDWGDDIAYAIGKKTLSDGKNLVLVAIRGSSSSLDWLSNFAIGNAVAGCFWHAGFESAANKVYSDLNHCIGGDFSNTVFVITGHSRGAAAANLLEVKLFNAGVAQKDVYGYNFACPDVATGLPTGWNWMGEHDNIFNIGNSPDIVSVAPGVLGSIFASGVPVASSWGKFGQSRWFSNDWNSIYETALDVTFAAHGQEVYLRYLGQEPAFSSFKTWEQRMIAMTVLAPIQSIGKQFSVFCPVDVIVEDDNGAPIASVIDNKVHYYNSKFGEVIIFTDGDRKSIYVQGNDPLSLRLTATDSGTMEYIVKTVDLNLSEVLSEKSFAAVTLTPNKQMLSLTDVEAITGVGKDVSKVPLYVLDNNGQPELKVLPDGKGTEVPLDATIYTVAFNASGGTVNPSYAITDSAGKLTSLPTPIFTDHKFNGWFTTSSGGTRITTETVFKSDTTIYAQWTKSSTNPGGTVNPGNPTYNPGGTYVPPTYNITLPNVPGGKISVNPTSASSGSTVTITTVPDAGYKLTSLTVSDANGKNLELSNIAENQYTFKMPNGKVAITAQFQPINTDMSWRNPFADISERDWYFDAVKFVNRNGLMNGVGNGSFVPNARLSRAMFAQILYNKAERPSTASNNVFSDVPNGVWFTDAIVWAVANNIVYGYNGQFKPNDPITREQLVLMLWRYEGQPTSQSSLLGYVDANDTSDYALDAMCWAVENGVIKGKGNGTLDPKGFATRSEAAQVLKNYLEK